LDDSLPPDELPQMEFKKEESMGIKNFSSLVGDWPSMIDNSELGGVNELSLKPNIIINKDIVLLPEKTWQLLYDWYGGDQVFERWVIMNS